jgi:hypothetical protein
MENNEKKKYLLPNTIWESVIGHNTGCLMIDSVINDNIICHQIFDRGTFNERIGMTPKSFGIESFLIAFKPEENNPENDKIVNDHIGVKYNSNGDTVSASDESTESSNYLKMDGDKAQFDSGAIRYTKTGKGRYDLIPGDVISDIIGYAIDLFEDNNTVTVSKADIIEVAYRGEVEDRFKNTIINLVMQYYSPADVIQNDMGLPAAEVTIVSFMDGMANMLRDLAIHYENGAEKYGVDNWKKGIPVVGGDRGGSFMDSAMRHLTQYLIGLTDEPHQISCIWNCVCGLWTLQEEQKKKK